MKKQYFFIDESGDAAFYAKRKKLLVGTDGFQPVLSLGLVQIEDKKAIRQAIVNFQKQMLSDPLYSSIYSVSQPGWYLHARGDAPEIRAKFIEFLRHLIGIKVRIVIGRKKLRTFENKHNNNEKEFYFDLVYHMFSGLLSEEDVDYRVFLSAREKSTQHHLQTAIDKAIAKDNSERLEKLKITYQHDIVRSKDTPELSIVDYYLWALQRYILKGEPRFYNALQPHYTSIIDLYNNTEVGIDFNQENPFKVKNVSPFRKDGYL